MKHEISKIKDKGGSVGLTAATLPPWARLLIAKRLEEALPSLDARQIHDFIFFNNVLTPSLDPKEVKDGTFNRD